MRITKNDEIKCLKIQVKNLEEQLEIQKRRFDEYRMSEPEDLRTFLFKHMKLLQSANGCTDEKGRLFIEEVRHVAVLIKQIDDSKNNSTNSTDTTDD